MQLLVEIAHATIIMEDLRIKKPHKHLAYEAYHTHNMRKKL